MLLSRGARLALALHYLSWALYLLVVLPGALAATPSKRSANVSITFTPDLSRAAVVDAEFQGLSVQYQSVRRPLTSPVYRALLQNLVTLGARPMMRIFTPPPSGVEPLSTWVALANLSQALNLRVMPCADIKAQSSSSAATLIRNAVNTLGLDYIYAIEVANEPDLYASKLPGTYQPGYLTNGQFDEDLDTYFAAIDPYILLASLNPQPGNFSDTRVMGTNSYVRSTPAGGHSHNSSSGSGGCAASAAHPPSPAGAQGAPPASQKGSLLPASPPGTFEGSSENSSTTTTLNSSTEQATETQVVTLEYLGPRLVGEDMIITINDDDGDAPSPCGTSKHAGRDASRTSSPGSGSSSSSQSQGEELSTSSSEDSSSSSSSSSNSEDSSMLGQPSPPHHPSNIYDRFGADSVGGIAIGRGSGAVVPPPPPRPLKLPPPSPNTSPDSSDTPPSNSSQPAPTANQTGSSSSSISSTTTPPGLQQLELSPSPPSTSDSLNTTDDQVAQVYAAPACAYTGCFSTAANLTQFLGRHQGQLRLLTSHFYPYIATQPNLTWAALLSAAAVNPAGVPTWVAAAAGYGIPFRVTEANSVALGGQAGVSDTLAAALWLLDYSFELAAAGGIGVNWMVSYCRPYSPIIDGCSTCDCGASNSTRANAPYMGMLAFVTAVGAGARVWEGLPDDMSKRAGVKVWVVQPAGNQTRFNGGGTCLNVVVINKNVDLTGSATIDLPANLTTPTLRVVRLEGDAPNATITSIRLGGQTPDVNATMQPVNQSYLLLTGTQGSSSGSGSGGGVPKGYIRFSVDVPPVSAALLLCDSEEQPPTTARSPTVRHLLESGSATKTHKQQQHT